LCCWPSTGLALVCQYIVLRSPDLDTGLQAQSDKCQIRRNSRFPWLPGCCLAATAQVVVGHLCPKGTACCLLSTKTSSCFSAEFLFPQSSPSLSCCVGFSRLENSICSSEPGVQLVLYATSGTLPSLYLTFCDLRILCGNGSKALLKWRCEQCSLLLPCTETWLFLPQRQLNDFQHALFSIKSEHCLR